MTSKERLSHFSGKSSTGSSNRRREISRTLSSSDAQSSRLLSFRYNPKVNLSALLNDPTLPRRPTDLLVRAWGEEFVSVVGAPIPPHPAHKDVPRSIFNEYIRMVKKVCQFVVTGLILLEIFIPFNWIAYYLIL